MSPEELSATREPIYQWQDGVESLEGYRHGGYHPTHIGDLFNDGRYQVVHKLGYGSSSTVWLARDHQYNKYVALKISIAEASASRETQILHRLESSDEHPGREFTSYLLDEFTFEGPNGSHLCIVTHVAGCSLAQSKAASLTWKFPLPAARSLAAQVLLGLDYVHSRGVVHGDLHLNNILLQLRNLDQCKSDEALYERLGLPLKLPVERLDGNSIGPEAPKYCVQPAMIFVPSEEIEDPKILICDLGEAFYDTEDPKILNTPMTLLPPELFFHERLGPAIDIWTMGCTIFEILGERPLFEALMPDEDDIIAEMISTLGELPKKWWDQWKLKGDFFDEDGSWRRNDQRSHELVSRPLKERLRTMGRGEDLDSCEFSGEEMAALEKLLAAMLKYDPKERITSSAACTSEWMATWGRPSVQGGEGL